MINRWSNYETRFEYFLLSNQEELNDEEFKLLEDRHAEFEDKYNESLRAFRQKLEELENEQAVNFNINQNTNAVRVRMPEIKLSEFSGVLEDWVPFWNRFYSLVHNRVHLDNVCKMTYLVSCLKGPVDKRVSIFRGRLQGRGKYPDRTLC